MEKTKSRAFVDFSRNYVRSYFIRFASILWEAFYLFIRFYLNLGFTCALGRIRNKWYEQQEKDAADVHLVPHIPTDDEL